MFDVLFSCDHFLVDLCRHSQTLLAHAWKVATFFFSQNSSKNLGPYFERRRGLFTPKIVLSLKEAVQTFFMWEGGIVLIWGIGIKHLVQRFHLRTPHPTPTPYLPLGWNPHHVPLF